MNETNIPEGERRCTSNVVAKTINQLNVRISLCLAIKRKKNEIERRNDTAKTKAKTRTKTAIADGVKRRSSNGSKMIDMDGADECVRLGVNERRRKIGADFFVIVIRLTWRS